MEFADNPLIRRTLAEQPGKDPHAKQRAWLWNALLQFRERAAVLANAIQRDLPDFTDHGLTHLDALWEMADLIAGPDYPINPLEAFVLGGVFLIHDLGLGLAAWPGGPAGIKQGAGWGDAVSALLRKRFDRVPTPEELTSPPADIERAAIQERLRMLHAEQAERLALASFPANPKEGETVFYLLEDGDLRQQLAGLIGRIAHSHWWPVSRLANEIGTTRGALSNCPSDWTIDPLKVAVLLRTADAAHLDTRRAPGFLLSLRRPEGLSRGHWDFQNHLLKAQAKDDRLVYTTNRPFLAQEVDSWWLCEESLRMVDRELHQVDSLLADRGRPHRLRARGVAGAESPQRLKRYIEVEGWTPVDARLHVSDVADLARKLGGEQLYGNDLTVPLRELIQNASDAVRARRVLEGFPADWGRVTVRIGQDEQGPWVEVQDTGIGMSEDVLSGPLLDFGATYWGSALMREEHEGLWAKSFEPTGRFGIGFFSVFMWGHQVCVKTRRYDDGARDTLILEFRTGLEVRPLIRPAQPGERLREPGTLVRVWIKGGRDFREYGHEFGRLCAWIAPTLAVDLYADDGTGDRRLVSASDWLTIDGSELIDRLIRSKKWIAGNEISECGHRLRALIGPDGQVLGRATICATESRVVGAITVGGLRSDTKENIAGVLLGSVRRASRDHASPLVDRASLSAWASDQSIILDNSVEDRFLRIAYASIIVGFEGNPGDLPVAVMGSNFVTFDYLSRWKDIPNEIALIEIKSEYDSILKGEVILNPSILAYYNPGHQYSSIQRLISQALSNAWGYSPRDVESEFLDKEIFIGVNIKGFQVTRSAYQRVWIYRMKQDEP